MVVGVLIVPQIALASWWNPFTWLKKTNNPVVESNRQIVAPITEAVPTVASSTVSVKTTPIPKKVTPSKKVTEVKKEQNMTLPTQSLSQVSKKSIADAAQCNGVSYSACPSGTTLVCPTVGRAYCYTPKTDQQICEEKFGVNSNYSGQKNQQGGALCDCKSGYTWNNINTACVAVPVNVAPTYTSTYSDTYSGLGRNVGVVAFYPSGCDYFLVETSLGYTLMEWYSGHDPSEGDVLYGNLNSYSFKDITDSNGNNVHVWIDDYMLSKSRALSKYYDKCD